MIGREGFGQVEEVGPNVAQFKPGDFVVATVRRPGSSLYNKIGNYDMTTDDAYFERGISRLHGFLTEYYVNDPEYIVKIPQGLKDVAVLLEPMTVVQKGIGNERRVARFPFVRGAPFRSTMSKQRLGDGSNRIKYPHVLAPASGIPPCALR